MADETALRAAIAETPKDWQVQLVYADWLAERDRPEEASWRWIAAFRRRPVGYRLSRIDHEPYRTCTPCNYSPNGHFDGDGWINGRDRLGRSTMAWPWSHGMATIPEQLFRWLPKTHHFAYSGWDGDRPYNSIAEAFDALVTAYTAATRPRKNRFDRIWNGPVWEPDWTLVNQVPDE